LKEIVMTCLFVLICVCFSIFPDALSQTMQKENYTYLALGDSYTIGEGLPLQDNFPNQTVRFLNKAGYSMSQATIVAKTGWTTHELQAEITSRSLDKNYDIVSLLIGVNNQYRGQNPKNYELEFEELLRRSIAFASKNPAHVFVLSIPDWGVTPYAEGRDREKISKEIDSFNFINKRVSEKWSVNYIDITSGSRDTAEDRSLIAHDGLHPSAKEYSRWAGKLATSIQQQLK
jgi:lysophospholipase L1-like esterase